jgi:hypothetical protein
LERNHAALQQQKEVNEKQPEDEWRPRRKPEPSSREQVNDGWSQIEENDGESHVAGRELMNGRQQAAAGDGDWRHGGIDWRGGDID